MKFGPVPIAKAAGSVLAHSVKIGKKRLRKGVVLDAVALAALAKAGIKTVTVAQFEGDDIGEDQAAEIIAVSLITDKNRVGFDITNPVAGRVNIIARNSGVLTLDSAAIAKINAVSDDITLATLANWARVAKGAMIATVKIIPYGVSQALVDMAARDAALYLNIFKQQRVSLILTQTDGFDEKILAKGRQVVNRRVQALGSELGEVITVPHQTQALADALAQTSGDMILLLTASATSDVHDVGPAALVQAGGRMIRFGMPVDPGNLLFLGELDGRPVVGLPGCARSPALNGADWVLERLAARLPVTNADIAVMGVGGLLKEIPTRPQPRSIKPAGSKQVVVEGVLLAAGSSARMRGRDKLLEQVGNKPLLRHVAVEILKSKIGRLHVVVQPDNEARIDALTELDVNIVTAPRWRDGMAASIRAGLAAVSGDCDAVIIALADMPDVTAAQIDPLIKAFDPTVGREICRALTADGTPGLPVLFGRRFFESLGNLQGDVGAKQVLKDAVDFVVDVKTAGQAAVIDLDTPQAWADWRKAREMGI